MAQSPPELVGWIYKTRGGAQFVQVLLPTRLGAIFDRLGDKRLGERVAISPPATYYGVSSETASALRTTRTSGVVLASCYGAGS